MYESILLGDDGMMPDMVKYLERHALVYDSPPTEGIEGIPLGNGTLSAMCWQTARSFEMHLNDARAYDRRQQGDFRAWSWEGEERHSVQVSVGHLTIEDGLPAFDVNYLRRYRATLDLGRAVMALESEAQFARWTARGFASRDPSVLTLEVKTSSAEPVERRVRLERWGTRSFTHYYEQFVDDPSVRLAETESGIRDGCLYVLQRLTGGHFATVMKVTGEGASPHVLHSRAVEVRIPPGKSAQFTVLVSCEVADAGEDVVGVAAAHIERADSDPEGLLSRHFARWKEYWQRSLVLLPESEDYLENLYYLHFYSLFSCGLGALPPNFTGGGWTWNGDVRNWGHIYHWNQQQILWALDTSGRPELADNYFALCGMLLPRAREDAREIFAAEGAFYSDIANVNGSQAIEPDTARNLTVGPLIALAMWDHFLFTGDLRFLKDQCYPLLDACARLYRFLLRRGEDGLRRIAGGSTPYESYWILKETLTDGCAIRALAKVVESARTVLGMTAGEGEPVGFAEDLPELATLSVKDGAGVEKRIFSAGMKWDDAPVGFEEGRYPNSPFPATLLAPVFPFAIVGLKDRGSALFSIAVNTVRLFLDTNVYRIGAYGASGHTPSPEAACRLGMREDARAAIRLFARRYQRFPNGFTHYASLEDGHYDDGRGFFQPRALRGDEKETRYAELHDKGCGERRPLDSRRFLHMYYESSSNIAAGIQEMLLQSHEGIVRLFPAFPDSGRGAFSLHARGGFRVASETLDGKVRYISIASRAGGKIRVELPWAGPVAICRDGGEVGMIHSEGDVVEIEIPREGSILLYPAHKPITSYYRDSGQSAMNKQPKRFEGVILGKLRNF
jgi:hypothetical protein